MLICTDLAARGLDMVVDVVVQYGLPLNGDTYVHRLGRTARAGRSGQGIVLVAKKEYTRWKEILTVVTKNQEDLQPKIFQMEVKRLDEARDRVDLAEKARINNRRVEADGGQKWLQKEADMADIILDQKKPSGEDIARKFIKKIWLPKPVDRQQ
jgi:superfamily II DNA/RNA helicase